MGPLAQAFCLIGIEMLFHDKKMLQSQSPQLRVSAVQLLQRLFYFVVVALRTANRQRQSTFCSGDSAPLPGDLCCEVSFQRFQPCLLRFADRQLTVHPIVKVGRSTGERLAAIGGQLRMRIRMGVRVGVTLRTRSDFGCNKCHAGRGSNGNCHPRCDTR